MVNLEIKDLKKYYGLNRGVENAGFAISSGEILGFVGPNGAGKSTVIRLIMGLIRKNSGEIQIFGEKPSSTVNRRIGYLPGEVFMFPELRVEEQLRYFSEIRKCGETRWRELAEYFDLDLNRRVGELSFGNKKKIGIVAALMHSPELIILDEPTSGLDPLIQKKFFELLEEEKKHGASILLSSHVLNDVEKICDRVCLIKNGEVLFSQGISELKEAQRLKVTMAPVLQIDLPDLVFLSQTEEEISYLFKGDVNALILELSKYQLTKLHINEMEFEEIFMHYYQKEKSDV
jgi:ABC-2 type transport system ATP-binding protein